MTQATERKFRTPEMEGAIARWYAKIRGTDSQLQLYREQAARLTDGLPDGAEVLEVAPGPGYLAIEMARSGRLRVTALDISHTFVEIASRAARDAGVSLDAWHGDVGNMPFGADRFHRIVCQAAFKNFRRPLAALDEMYRVLRPGGTAVIEDMNSEATGAEIASAVRQMRLGPVNSFATRRTLGMLRRRAYSPDRFHRLAESSAFRSCDIGLDGIGMEIRLTKPAA
ncbi:MAG TPA: class I SAM-dependent methyltransferase [Rugosimonospora sp.]|nr:class I SAM-dependent methyltransferase [Rugosimonospora sp.]